MNMKRDLVFISTFIDKQNIDSLINTVIINNQGLSVFFIIINQTKSEVAFPFSSLVDFHQINTERLSLSKARNTAINYLIKNKIDFEHVMYPDDDTTFSDTFFTQYKEHIKADKNYLIDVYCAGSKKLFKQINHKNGDVLYGINYDSAISVNMIINYKTFFSVGMFDERIGVGAKYGAGEDADYFIRACNVSRHGFIYTNLIYNFHPSSTNKFSKLKLKQTINNYINYGNGAIFMLCKHKMYFEALKTCFRSLGGAVVYFCKFNLKLTIAYSLAFFSRFLMFFKCLIYSKR